MARNLTLALDDDLLAQYRVLAAQRKTTVNALIRKHIEEELGGEERRKEAREWMVAKATENIARDAERDVARARGEPVEDETWRWSREDTYSGHRFERPRGS